MKNLLLLSALVVLCSGVFAQGISISVKSSTTIDLKAEAIIFTVPHDPVENSMFGAMDMFDEEYDYEEDNKWSLEEIADALARDGYEFRQIISDNGPKYEISVSDEEQLNAVKGLMLNIGVDGAVTDVTYEDPSAYYADIFHTLTVDANLQAEVLAAANNKKVVSLVSITEPEQQSFDMGSYMDMFKDGGALQEMMGMGGPALTKEYTKEMVFTFAVSY